MGRPTFILFISESIFINVIKSLFGNKSKADTKVEVSIDFAGIMQISLGTKYIQFN